MKYPCLAGLCLSLTLLSSVVIHSQDSPPVNEPDLKKPLLFTNLPSKVPLETSFLKALINVEKGKEVSVQMGKTALEGKVISSVRKYNNIQSVIIRSSNFNGATLTLSSSTRPDGTVKISGRLLSLQHGDLYELQKENEQYVLIKKNYYDLINE